MSESNEPSRTRRRRRSRRRTGRALVAVGLATTLVLAACGDDSDSGDAAPTTSDGSGDVSSVQADAQAFVDAHTEPLGGNPDLPPLSKRPDTGKTVVYVGNASPTSQAFQDGAKKAAELLGWELKTITTAVTPETAQAAFKLALTMKPDAVIDSGWPPIVIQEQLDELASKNIPVISWGTTAKLGESGIVARLTQAEDEIERGEWVAQWVLADKGEDANVMYVSLDAYDLLKIHHEAFTSTISDNCSSCKVKDLPVGLTDLGAGLPTTIVNALRANPEVNYVIPAYDDMSIGLPEALEAAGLADRVKIADNGGGTVSRENVAKGAVAVSVPDSPLYLGWVAMDAIARAFNGDEIPDASYAKTPRIYLTKDNIGDPAKPFIAYPGYEEFLKELWQL